MTDDMRWDEEPGDRITSMLAAVTEALSEWNEKKAEPGEDLHGIFVLHDGRGGAGASAFGYDSEASYKLVGDFIRFSSMLFTASGIRMDVRFIHDPGEPLPEPEPGTPVLEPRLEESDPGQPRALLTITHTYPDPQIPVVIKAVKASIEANLAVNEVKAVVLLITADGSLAVMQHGFEGPHEMVHALVSTLMSISADDKDSHVVIIPVIGSPN